MTEDGLQAGFRLEGRYIEAFLGEAGVYRPYLTSSSSGRASSAFAC